jgi:RimJ/RimL family protein N-acetyltransferase
MTKNFATYYRGFLDIPSGTDLGNENIFCSEQRACPFASDFKHYLVATSYFNDSIVFSVAPEFYQDFKNYIPESLPLELNRPLIDLIDNFFEAKIPSFYSLRTMCRFSFLNNTPLPQLANQVRPLSSSHQDQEAYLHFISPRPRGSKFLDRLWAKKIPIVEEGRLFVCFQDGQILSYAEISDIDYQGANVVVETKSNYRNQGLGKAVVSRAIEWCRNNALIPIYWVEERNAASISLAISLGFKLESTEIVVSVTI